jgi:sialidase-1
MRKFASMLAMLLLLVPFVYAQQSKVSVFTSGEEGYKSYRIPAIVKLPKGDLIAFCEGRVNDSDDFGNIDIVMKRSNDNGKSWSKLQVVVDNDHLQAGNCAPVIDLTDPAYPKGRLFLFYNTGNNHEGEVRKGKGLREVWYKTSLDGGGTWSEPVNITLQVHKPNQPQINPAYHFSEDWRSFANTPGHALQFEQGKYKGRIYIPANHSAGNPLPHFNDYKANGYYTDDHGKTFHISEDVSTPGGNECMAAPVYPNGLVMNIRNQSGSEKARIIAYSKNGGESWDTTYNDKDLPDPVCQGSILRLDSKKGKNVLAFCNAADTSKRDNLTLRISLDGGRTWARSITVDKSPDGQKNNSAYSDIVQIGKNEIGVLYEKDEYTKIVFTTVSIGN